jgi:hypothetical protein
LRRPPWSILTIFISIAKALTSTPTPKAVRRFSLPPPGLPRRAGHGGRRVRDG